jgi:hypothetical protein
MVEVRESLREFNVSSSEAPESKPEFDSGDSCDQEARSSKHLRVPCEGPSVCSESRGLRRESMALAAASQMYNSMSSIWAPTFFSTFSSETRHITKARERSPSLGWFDIYPVNSLRLMTISPAMADPAVPYPPAMIEGESECFVQNKIILRIKRVWVTLNQ